MVSSLCARYHARGEHRATDLPLPVVRRMFKGEKGIVNTALKWLEVNYDKYFPCRFGRQLLKARKVIRSVKRFAFCRKL